MHSPCNKNYLSLQHQFMPLDNATHRDMVEMLREIFDRRGYDIQQRVGMFCYAIALATRYMNISSVLEEDREDLLIACMFIHEAIQHHGSEMETCADSLLPAAIIQALRGLLYTPTCVDLLESLNENYNLMNSRCLETARALLCVAHGVDRIFSLSAEAMASAAYNLTQVLEGCSSQKCLPRHAESTQAEVDTLYRCVTCSPLFDYLPDRLKVAACEYASSRSDIPDEDDTTFSALLPTSPSPAGLPREITISRKKQVALGSGESSTVVRVKATNNTQVAMKKQSSEMIFLKEVSLTASLRHRNIQAVELIIATELSFCMPAMSHNLRQEIESHSLTPEKYRRYIRELFSGVAYLQDCAVIHGDIKPENLLISYDGELKISDFGQSIGWMTSAKEMPSRYITPLYRPFELYAGSERCLYGLEVDMWSCGIVILEMTHGEDFTEALCINVPKGIKVMLDDRLEGVTEGMDRDIATIVRQCLSIPLCRISARQCLAMLYD